MNICLYWSILTDLIDTVTVLTLPWIHVCPNEEGNVNDESPGIEGSVWRFRHRDFPPLINVNNQPRIPGWRCWPPLSRKNYNTHPLSSSCPHCDGIIAANAKASLPSLQWCCCPRRDDVIAVTNAHASCHCRQWWHWCDGWQHQRQLQQCDDCQQWWQQCDGWQNRR